MLQGGPPFPPPSPSLLTSLKLKDVLKPCSLPTQSTNLLTQLVGARLFLLSFTVPRKLELFQLHRDL